jgi:hypothetical protein
VAANEVSGELGASRLFDKSLRGRTLQDGRAAELRSEEHQWYRALRTRRRIV